MADFQSCPWCYFRTDQPDWCQRTSVSNAIIVKDALYRRDDQVVIFGHARKFIDQFPESRSNWGFVFFSLSAFHRFSLRSVSLYHFRAIEGAKSFTGYACAGLSRPGSTRRRAISTSLQNGSVRRPSLRASIAHFSHTCMSNISVLILNAASSPHIESHR